MTIAKKIKAVILGFALCSCSREGVSPVEGGSQDFGVSKFYVVLNLQYVREKQSVLVTIKNQSEQEIQFFGTDVSGEPNRNFFRLCKVNQSGLKVSGKEVSQTGHSGSAATLAPQKEYSFEAPLNPEERELLKKQGLVAGMSF